MMQKTILILIVVSLLGLNGCATVGIDYNEDRVQELIVGISTRQDAIAMFGQPSGVHKNADGETLIWTHAKAMAFAISTTGKSLALIFNKDGILTGHHSTNIQSGL